MNNISNNIKLYLDVLKDFCDGGTLSDKIVTAREVCTCTCCGSILSLVQFFIFLHFILIIIHYHVQKQRKTKIEPMIKLNHNIY